MSILPVSIVQCFQSQACDYKCPALLLILNCQKHTRWCNTFSIQNRVKHTTAPHWGGNTEGTEWCTETLPAGRSPLGIACSLSTVAMTVCMSLSFSSTAACSAATWARRSASTCCQRICSLRMPSENHSQHHGQPSTFANFRDWKSWVRVLADTVGQFSSPRSTFSHFGIHSTSRITTVACKKAFGCSFTLFAQSFLPHFHTLSCSFSPNCKATQSPHLLSCCFSPNCKATQSPPTPPPPPPNSCSFSPNCKATQSPHLLSCCFSPNCKATQSPHSLPVASPLTARQHCPHTPAASPLTARQHSPHTHFLLLLPKLQGNTGPTLTSCCFSPNCKATQSPHSCCFSPNCKATQSPHSLPVASPQTARQHSPHTPAASPLTARQHSPHTHFLLLLPKLQGNTVPTLLQLLP